MLTIEIDGNEVSLRGTAKGDGSAAALRGTAWRWGGRARAWVLPRNLQPGTRERNIRAAKAALEAAGFEVTTEDTGERLSVAEEREQAEQRLTERAERLENRAERLGREAAGRLKTADDILNIIPPGQPILVGHYSERGHRRALEKVDTNIRKGYEAEREAEDAARRAANITRGLANGTPTRTLRLRIERYEAELRDIERKLAGTSVASGYGRPATGGWRERLLETQARTMEALELDRAELARRAEEDGVKVWGPDDFQKGDEVAYWGGWAKVLRVNKKSLTVPHGFIERLTQTLPYPSVKARRRDGEVTR